MKRAIITGATGAIGTALITELLSHGVEILVLCRKDSCRNNNIPSHPFVEKKYCALEELSAFESKEDKQYDVFYHLAWEGTVGVARNDMYLQNRNVKYCLDAVNVAKRFGCKTFIGIGSQAEYGRCEGVLRAQTPVFPENGYGMAKLVAGQMTRVLAHQLGLHHLWVRVLSVYGPNDGLQSLVMSLISNLIHGKSPKMTKGEQTWDYLYSGDAANALYLLGEKGIDGKTYVLGNGKAKPLCEYAEVIRKVVKPEVPIDFGAIPYAEQQVMNLCADISELTQDTGWLPQNSFEKGITATFEDYLKKQTNT